MRLNIEQSMLPTTLNTNEVKDAAGAELEFGRIRTNERQLEFALLTEAPNLPFRINVSHIETGEGNKKTRRSVIRVDKTHIGADSLTPITTSAYVVVSTQVGLSASYDTLKTVLAALAQLCFSRGTGTTILYDGTGYGSEALINGSL